MCAWLLTSGGFQLTERLRRSVTLALARSGADQAHTLATKSINKQTPSHSQKLTFQMNKPTQQNQNLPTLPTNQTTENKVTNSQMTAVCALGY